MAKAFQIADPLQVNLSDLRSKSHHFESALLLSDLYKAALTLTALLFAEVGACPRLHPFQFPVTKDKDEVFAPVTVAT